MALPPDVEVFTADDAYLVALWRNVFFTAWWGDVTAAKLRDIGTHQRQVARRLPTGFVSFGLLTAANINLPADVRAEAQRVTKESPTEMKAVAQIVFGTGFAAAAV